MERAVKERMAIQEIETMMPYDLVNQKPVAAAIKEFWFFPVVSIYGSNKPLSAVTHKRRLSALGQEVLQGKELALRSGMFIAHTMVECVR